MKLHLFGASGSGVTTLGNALAARLGLPYFDSDDYFWLPTDPPFTQRRDPEERNKLILDDLDKAQNWILGGSVIHWGDDLFPPFDLVVFLYLPLEIRLDRLKKREIARYGDSLRTDPERRNSFDRFLAWATDYDHNTGIANRTLEAHKAWLSRLKHPILELYGDLSVEERVRRVVENM